MSVGNTDPMSKFTVLARGPVSDSELLALYESVGWGAYTREPKVLTAAVRGSSFVVTARTAGGDLIGLARAISDDAPSAICYLLSAICYLPRRKLQPHSSWK